MRYIENGAGGPRIVWSASDLKAAAECEFAWLRVPMMITDEAGAVPEPAAVRHPDHAARPVVPAAPIRTPLVPAAPIRTPLVPAATVPTPSAPPDGGLRYRCLTGPDDAEFCRRVSQALDEGYVLVGGPSVTFNGRDVIVAQAVVWPYPDVHATVGGGG